MGSTNNYTKIMHLKEELLNTVKLPFMILASESYSMM